MARMESLEDRDKKVTVRISGKRLARLEEHCEEHDLAQSDLIRAGIDAITEGPHDQPQGPRIKRPDEPKLAEAFETLQQLAEPRDGTIPEVQALSVLAQQPGEPVDVVQMTILIPLEDFGIVARQTPWRGRNQLRVALPEDAERLAAEEEMEREPACEEYAGVASNATL